MTRPFFLLRQRYFEAQADADQLNHIARRKVPIAHERVSVNVRGRHAFTLSYLPASRAGAYKFNNLFAFLADGNGWLIKRVTLSCGRA